MPWRTTVFCMLLSAGCSVAQPMAARVAPLVPRLEVRLRALETGRLDVHAQDARRQRGWDVVVVANLRWRTSSQPWGPPGWSR